MRKILMKASRHFTLVEIMIAMAVLIIMMGFLFRFIISAQRLWSASNDNDIIFEQAQLCFSFIEKDLKAAIVQKEESNPGRQILYYVNEDDLDGATPATLIFLIAQTGNKPATLNATNGSDALPVVYYLDDDNNLYRRIIDDEIDSKAPLHCFGLSEGDFESYLDNTIKPDSEFQPTTSEYCLCKNITRIKLIKLYSSPTIDEYSKPEAVKITLELKERTAVLQANNTSPEAKTRLFSKTIFLH